MTVSSKAIQISATKCGFLNILLPSTFRSLLETAYKAFSHEGLHIAVIAAKTNYVNWNLAMHEQKY